MHGLSGDGIGAGRWCKGPGRTYPMSRTRLHFGAMPNGSGFAPWAEPALCVGTPSQRPRSPDREEVRLPSVNIRAHTVRLPSQPTERMLRLMRMHRLGQATGLVLVMVATACTSSKPSPTPSSDVNVVVRYGFHRSATPQQAPNEVATAA